MGEIGSPCAALRACMKLCLGIPLTLPPAKYNSLYEYYYPKHLQIFPCLFTLPKGTPWMMVNTEQQQQNMEMGISHAEFVLILFYSIIKPSLLDT
jgi:hypothetical protein